MPRRPRSRKERARLFELHGGICHLCEGRIGVGEAWELEHVIPLEISGDESDGNVKPAHEKCHKRKTPKDAADIAKAKRRQDKHSGAWKPTSRPIPGSKRSGWKRRMDGTIERRDQ